MKKNLRVILLFSLGLLFSCQDQLIKDPGDSKQKKFTTSDAKSYFVQNAEYLRPLTFNQESKESRSSLLRDLNLRMDWDKAFYSKLGDAELIEVPIKSNSILYAKEKSTLGVNKQDRITISSRKLIISREEDDNYKMFIVTLIPDHKAVVNKSYTAEHFKYLGGSNYSGLIFCSELDGTFGDVFLYENGFMSQRMSLSRKNLSCDHDDCKDHHHSDQKEIGPNDIVLNFKEVIDGQHISRSFFDSDIDGNGCYYCSDGSCMSCRNNELGEIVVTPDPCYWCWSYPCVCYSACYWCYSNPCICNQRCIVCYSYPCICSFCRYCGSRYCYGSCQNTGGGSGGNNGNGNSNGSNNKLTNKLMKTNGLTEEQKRILEKMFEEIVKDCMGGKLYNSLVDVLNGEKLNIEFNTNFPGAAFFPAESKITIGVSESSNLFHELFHLEQMISGNGSWTYNQLNREVEAFVADYLYRKRNNGATYNTPTEKNINNFSKHLKSNGTYESTVPNKKINSGINNIKKSLTKIKSSHPDYPEPYKNMPWDSTESNTAMLSNLVKLSKDC